jgi:hypothetical protein
VPKNRSKTRPRSRTRQDQSLNRYKPTNRVPPRTDSAPLSHHNFSLCFSLSFRNCHFLLPLWLQINGPSSAVLKASVRSSRASAHGTHKLRNEEIRQQQVQMVYDQPQRSPGARANALIVHVISATAYQGALPWMVRTQRGELNPPQPACLPQPSHARARAFLCARSGLWKDKVRECSHCETRVNRAQANRAQERHKPQALTPVGIGSPGGDAVVLNRGINYHPPKDPRDHPLIHTKERCHSCGLCACALTTCDFTPRCLSPVLCPLRYTS